MNPRQQILQSISEKQFMLQVVEMATLFNWLCYHTYDSRRSVPGFPDLVLVKAHQPVIFAELKTENGRLTPEQFRWMTLLGLANGCENYVWHPSDIEAIEARLRAPDQPKVGYEGYIPKPRSVVAAAIRGQLAGRREGPLFYFPDKASWHYGKMELRALLDFMYDGRPRTPMEEL